MFLVFGMIQKLPNGPTSDFTAYNIEAKKVLVLSFVIKKDS